MELCLVHTSEELDERDVFVSTDNKKRGPWDGEGIYESITLLMPYEPFDIGFYVYKVSVSFSTESKARLDFMMHKATLWCETMLLQQVSQEAQRDSRFESIDHLTQTCVLVATAQTTEWFIAVRTFPTICPPYFITFQSAESSLFARVSCKNIWAPGLSQRQTMARNWNAWWSTGRSSVYSSFHSIMPLSVLLFNRDKVSNYACFAKILDSCVRAAKPRGVWGIELLK